MSIVMVDLWPIFSIYNYNYAIVSKNKKIGDSLLDMSYHHLRNLIPLKV